MPISYAEALEVLQSVGREMAPFFQVDYEILRPEQAIGRTVKDNLICQISTPAFDTSAMGGFAVNSDSTTEASESNPLILGVKGTMAAGDAPFLLSADSDEDNLLPCVEIMTGAQFPHSLSEKSFDACIPVEHTKNVDGPRTDRRYVQVSKPVLKFQHRRRLGGDFQKDSTILAAGSVVQSRHVMAMAAIGVEYISVFRKVRIGIWSTGAELLTTGQKHEAFQNKIVDVNGPYLMATLQSLGADAFFLGVIKDDYDMLAATIAQYTISSAFDILITTGAISAGKFDHVRQAIESIGAQIDFHKVSIRPGHPVLFATLPARLEQEQPLQDVVHPVSRSARKIAFFGLPGNPVATAACLRVIVLPYLRHLVSQPHEQHIFARVVMIDNCEPNGNGNSLTIGDICSRQPPHLDVFRHGRLHMRENCFEVTLSEDQSPSKIRPFSEGLCWVHIPRGHGDLKQGDLVRCLSFLPGESML